MVTVKVYYPDREGTIDLPYKYNFQLGQTWMFSLISFKTVCIVEMSEDQTTLWVEYVY